MTNKKQDKEFNYTLAIAVVLIVVILAIIYLTRDDEKESVLGENFGSVSQSSYSPEKPMVGVIRVDVTNSTMTFHCLDEYTYEKFNLSGKMFDDVGLIRVSKIESEQFSYRYEESEKYYYDPEQSLHLYERFKDTSWIRFTCNGRFRQPIATTTTWISGREKRRNISYYDEIRLQCGKAPQESLVTCQMFYRYDLVDKYKFVELVTQDIKEQALDERLS